MIVVIDPVNATNNLGKSCFNVYQIKCLLRQTYQRLMWGRASALMDRRNIDEGKEHPLLNLLGITEQCATFQNHYSCSLCSNKQDSRISGLDACNRIGTTDSSDCSTIARIYQSRQRPAFLDCSSQPIYNHHHTNHTKLRFFLQRIERTRLIRIELPQIQKRSTTTLRSERGSSGSSFFVFFFFRESQRSFCSSGISDCTQKVFPV